MSQEVTLTASLSVLKSTVMSAAVARSITGGLFNMSGDNWIESVLSVATTETLIPLGGAVMPHWAYFKNLDSTNYIKIRPGTGLADLIRLLPGEPAFLPLDPSAVPYAIADTAACLMEYAIFSI